MNIISVLLLFFLAGTLGKDCPSKQSNSKLFCYYSKLTHIDSCQCSHIILPANSDVKAIDRVREHAKGVKILITVNEFNQGLINIIKSSKVDGLEINLKKLDSKNDISDFISTVRSKLGSNLYLALSVPAKAETLAKFFDFKSLSKHADTFILQTSFLGASQNVTFHPSRLSGIWDMQNTDSVVDLVSGLGAPLSKLVISAPVQAFQFTLQSTEHTAPGSPAVEVKSITRDELCKAMNNGANWTLERDQDQAGPYIFSEDQWIAFEDSTSMDIKAKYSRVRGLAGMALKDLSQDGGTKCGSPILQSVYNGLSRQARAPRGAVLHSLEREILETPARPVDSVQVSPYRISRVIDVEGKVHVIRQDTRTEFECSRQGYFTHPRSCNRFYRCVKFNQLTDEFNVFEFDCPAGLAFDERVEVCVWPGSLSHGSACSGSSEIAPVPRERFICPSEQGYFADPENCRWFFACLDHGKSPLTAYEFRCPFGLVFDESRLICEWPWLVPKCGSGATLGLGLVSEFVYGGNGKITSLYQYDGLGSLETIQLGGLNGPLVQPVAKIYSNADGGAAVLSGSGLQGGLAVGSNLAAGYNSGGYINGYSGGLSTKAVQSLANAGLLRGNLVGLGQSTLQSTYGYNDIGLNSLDYSNLAGQYGLKSGVNGDALTYTKGDGILSQGVSAALSQGLLQQNSGGAGVADTTGTYITKADSAGVSNLSGFGAVNQNLVGRNLYNAAGQSFARAGLFGNNAKVGSEGLYTSGGIGLSSQSLASQSATSSQSFVQHSTAGAAVIGTGSHASSGTANVGGLSTVDYGGTFGSGIADNINIVGGGYSAVGLSKSGVEITNNGETASVLAQVTPSPIASTTISSIPVVTSVPLPSVQTAKSFESFNGGVIANIPELQYKVQTPSTLDYQGNSGATSYSNISLTNLGGYVSSTLVPITVTSVYTKPSLSLLHQPVKPSVVNVQSNLGYLYEKPLVRFKEISRKIVPVQPISTVAPFTTVNKAAISSFSYSAPSTVKPIIPVAEQKVLVQPTFASHIGNFVYQKPVVPATPVISPYIETSTLTPIVQNKIIQPIVHQNLIHPVAQPVVSTYSTLSPIVQQKVIQPVISAFSETSNLRPIVEENLLQSIGQPIVASYKETSSLRPSVQHKIVQPVVSTYIGTSTLRPAVQQFVQPIVEQKNVQQPAIISSFSFSAPRPSTIVQPATSSFNYRNEIASRGYVYEKPSIAFKEQPILTQKTIVQPVIQKTIHPAVTAFRYQPVTQRTIVTPIIQQKIQPAAVTSYFQQNLQPSVPVVQQNIQTVTQRTLIEPVIPVVHKTVIEPVVQKTVQPALNSYSYQPVTQKALVQTIVPAVQQNVQPAVVASYLNQNIQPAQPLVTKYGYRDIIQSSVVNQGYSYPKPKVSFEERPAVSTYRYYTPSTIKPAVVVQPEIQYTYSTPKPAVLQRQTPIVSSFNYVAPSAFPSALLTNEEQDYVSRLDYSSASPIKPAVISKQPAVISSYSYTASSTDRPAVVVQPEVQLTYSTPRPILVQKQVPVVSSYNYVAPAVAPNVVAKQEQQDYVAKLNYVTPVAVKPVVVQKQPAVSSSFSYTAPSTVRPEIIVQKQTPVVSSYNYVAPSVTPSIAITKQQDYVSRLDYVAPVTVKPVVVQKQPAVISSYSFTAPSTVRPETLVKTRPVVLPAVTSTPAPVIVQKQPSVVSSFSYTAPSVSKSAVLLEQQPTFEGYEYPKPSIAFAEGSGAVVTSYDSRVPIQGVPFVKEVAYVTGNSYSKANTAVDQQQIIENYQAPVQAYGQVNIAKQRPAISSNIGYPQHIYQENYISSTPLYEYNYVRSTPRPTYASTIASIVGKPIAGPEIIVQKQTPVVSSYNYVAPSVTPSIAITKQHDYVSRLDYVAPVTVKPVVIQKQPAVISSYSFTSPSTPSPEILVQQPVVVPAVTSTPAPVIVQRQPSAISSFSYTAPSFSKPAVHLEQQPAFEGYGYPKSSIAFDEGPGAVVTSYDSRVPVQEVPFVKKVAYVTGNSYSKANAAVDQQQIIENYQAPVQAYEQVNIAKQRPEIGSKIGYPQPIYQENYISSTPLYEYNYVQSTPRPTYTSTIASIIGKPIAREQNFYIYDSRLTSTTQRPIINAYTTAAPVLKIYSSSLPIVDTVTTSRPIAKYSFSSLDDQYQYVSTPAPQIQYAAPLEATTPRREYIPVKTRKRIPTTILPLVKTPKYVEAFIAPEVQVTPTKDYLPVRSRARITSTTAQPIEITTLSRDYLPSLVRKPVVRVVRPQPKTIVKVNDFHPLLSAKLGAQCTCTSSNVVLRGKSKKIKAIIVEDDDEDNDNNVANNAAAGPVIIENYEYQPDAAVDITPRVELFKSTTEFIEPAPTPVYTVNKHIRTRPVTSTLAYSPTTEAVGLFLNKDVTPAVSIIKPTSDGPSDREIVKAVRTGLKLVKQAAKEGAREGTEEAISENTFDRYGPGGWRSRNERLQGTIDCQRAGLFRHPTECNKFYACRWDCTKNRFTLHVFNCPVHLTFDSNIGACNWPSQGPTCLENTLLPSD